MVVSHYSSFLYLSFCSGSCIFSLFYKHFENRPTLLCCIHSQFSMNIYLSIYSSPPVSRIGWISPRAGEQLVNIFGIRGLWFLFSLRSLKGRWPVCLRASEIRGLTSSSASNLSVWTWVGAMHVTSASLTLTNHVPNINSRWCLLVHKTHPPARPSWLDLVLTSMKKMLAADVGWWYI